MPTKTMTRQITGLKMWSYFANGATTTTMQSIGRRMPEQRGPRSKTLPDLYLGTDPKRAYFVLTELNKVVDRIAQDAAAGELVALVRLLDDSPAVVDKCTFRELLIGRLVGLYNGRCPRLADADEIQALTMARRLGMPQSKAVDLKGGLRHDCKKPTGCDCCANDGGLAQRADPNPTLGL